MTLAFYSATLILKIWGNISPIFETLNSWLKRNLLSLNFGGKKLYTFCNKERYSWLYANWLWYNKAIPNLACTKFLGLLIDNTLTWKNHIELLINWLSTAFYVIWSVKPCMSRTTLITVYYALFRVVMTGGIIFWGNSTHSSKIFQTQKRAVRIIMGRRQSESCRNLFKELKILPLKSQYILSLLFCGQ